MAFKKVKAAFLEPESLSRPDPELPLILQTGVSGIGMGAALFQESPDGKRKIISYASTKLSPTEKRYHSLEQKCLSVIWSIRKYLPYLEDRPFILRTDGKALSWLNSVKASKQKLTKLHIFLTELSFQTEHVSPQNTALPIPLSVDPNPHEGIMPELELDRMALPTNIPHKTLPILNAIYAPSLLNYHHL